MAAQDDLRFFLLLARAGSLTLTARELGLSLSAVSKRLQQLEARLGVMLVNRTTRRLSLTAEGERYIQQGQHILEALTNLEQSLSSSDALSGRLSVNATFGFGRRHIAPLFSEFCARHPQIDGWLELTNFPLNLLDHGFDMAIRVGEPPDSRLIARPLLQNRRILCASPAYIARMPALQHPSDLVQQQCLVIRENHTDFPLWRFVARQHPKNMTTVKVNAHLSSNDGGVITRFALDGHGILLRSWWDVNEHLAQGSLVALLPDWQSVAADFYAVYERQRFMSGRLQAWLHFLTTHLATRVPPLAQY
ncbi:LysR family transcriptional regulator [Alishewanella tabrizica]|uniref:LysR family transcriptional regulator n=1 Tax=Alishewanella tabrizica TaxID=671278 RepID=A0ABQ2WRC4_9ALTE|nr:LysR family transcriptional regulator [Alishewanella tabrizica]GGW66437.1 LysR family transcriptional regulator [Alishewanella tabrizica]